MKHGYTRTQRAISQSGEVEGVVGGVGEGPKSRKSPEWTGFAQDTLWIFLIPTITKHITLCRINYSIASVFGYFCEGPVVLYCVIDTDVSRQMTCIGGIPKRPTKKSKNSVNQRGQSSARHPFRQISYYIGLTYITLFKNAECWWVADLIEFSNDDWPNLKEFCLNFFDSCCDRFWQEEEIR